MATWFSISAGVVVFAVSVGASYAQTDLVNLAKNDPNLFVETVQQALKDAGPYTGEISGLLDRETISAINQVCRDAKVLSNCQVGPLTPKGAAAVQLAIEAVVSSKPETGKQVAAPAVGSGARELEQPTAASEETLPASPPAKAVAWRETNIGNGLEVQVQPLEAGYRANAIGTAESNGWTNIVSSDTIKAEEGQVWKFSVDVAAELSGTGRAEVHLSAFGANNEYLGEVGSGSLIEGSAVDTHTVSGEAPKGTARVVPYIQLRYAPETRVEDTLTISDAFISLVQ